ncbi:thyrotropin-releasing hormone-degrading ectoenzyme-like isoform X2 [Panonychus citri]|uniref:thyrotropin-releasing hormone-degrading ectoenzyme-like isoform X2 n=1 Tax=Panonychus citri TaxID=50023 RepID=UPI002307087E|nr:thyrotropin-releasing hormone-degrading ectoenzyme-like isoform X2 [Panonychus citri]
MFQSFYQYFLIFSVFIFTIVTISSTGSHFDSVDGDLIADNDEDDDDDKRLFVNKTHRSSRFNMSIRFTNNRESTPLEPYVRLSSLLFKPYRYHVHWDLTEGIETFSGTVNISFMVLKSTNCLNIQINTLNISSLSLKYQDSGDTILVTKSWLSKSDIYVIETVDNVTDHQMISMFIKFTGTFQSLGFLIHQTTTPITRYTYMTKFEPIHARKAFPCFDEPDMKAHFKISVKHNSSLKAYSNMPLESIVNSSEIDSQNWSISTFKESPLMTTYLVALVVCDCQRSIASTSRGVEIGIITLKEDSNKTDYALSITVKCMEFFQQYLGIEYKFPKLDIFAAPHYPSFGMEHSGLIIQFYHRILYQKDGDYEVYNKEWILYTTAHEIAHQWFGNLVTLRWWEHTWLNEGFATYFATKAVEHVDPGMSSDDLFLINRYRTSLAYDLRGIYNPWNRTVAPIANANQIKQSFSWLSYQKGGSILRMMEDFIHHDNMTKLIRSYLTKHSDSNVVTRDFSEEAEKYYSEINMTEFIDSWTQQSGSPIITVTHNKNGTVRLSQISSLALKSYKESLSSRNPDSQENSINSTDSLTMEKNSPHIVSSSSSSTVPPIPSSSSSSSNRLVNESSVIWLIPITYKTSDGSSGLIWLTKSSQEYRLCDNCSWIVFNVNKKGYYIVNYSHNQWLTIIDALNSEPESFSPQTFTGLLLDVYYLFELGLVEVDIFFNLMSNVKRYSSLGSLWLALNWSKVSFAAPSFGEGRYLLYKYRRDLLESIYEKVSMVSSSSPSSSISSSPSSSSSLKIPQEPYDKMVIRYELLEDACEMKVPDCLGDSSKYLSSWIENGTYIPSYLQHVVFRHGMATLNNVTYWEFILNKLLTGNLNGIKGTALIRGLFAIKDDNLREKAYSLLKDTEYEIEASVLIETKCPTISSKPNPSKLSVLKWLIETNSYGFPWRNEKSSMILNLINSVNHQSSTENQINLVNQLLGNYSPAIIMIDQQSNHNQDQINRSTLRSINGPKSFELKGGFNLFPTFNHSIGSSPSFNINLVYRLTAAQPLASSSSSSGSHEGPTIIHSASTAFINILPEQLRIYLSPDKVRLTRLIDSDNGTELFLPFDNSI